MIIANNMAAMTVLSETNRQVRGANQASRELSLGQRVTGAEDDASTYSISEKMQTKVKALDQAKANSANGQSLLDTASQAVDQQVNILKLVKTIALKATDDTYSDSDRKILQKEVSQMLDQSEQIATTTNFNGIQLLDQSFYVRTDRTFDPTTPYHANSVNLTGKNVNEYEVPQGDYVDTSGKILYDPTKPLVEGSKILRLSPSDAGRWVYNRTDGSIGQVVGPDSNNDYYVGTTKFEANVLTRTTNLSELKYDSPDLPLSIGSTVTTYSKPSYINSATDFDKSGYEVVTAPGTGKVSYFVPGASSLTELDVSKIPMPTTAAALDGVGFTIDFGSQKQYVALRFDAETSESKFFDGDANTPLCYNIGLQGTPLNTTADLITAIFNGISKTNGMHQGLLPSTTDVTIDLTDNQDIKLNYIADTGRLTLSTDSSKKMTLKNGTTGSVNKVDLYNPHQLLALQTSDTSGQYNNIKMPNTTLSVLYPSAGDRWDIEPGPDDYPDPWPNEYHGLTAAEKKAKFKQEIWQYAVKSSAIDLNDCVTTREKANDFLDRTDQAIKYLLNSNTTLGAQYSRLDYTQDNLTTETENITAAESVLRDADMAKSATKLAKSNLLAQAAQSMLAQANQLPNKALEMLQG